MSARLYIVVPCYNESEVLPLSSGLFLDELKHLIQIGKVSPDSRILFVNDGSKDATWSIICNLAERDGHFLGICQSRNRGHQNALLAGLMTAKEQCDITITIDADGQDDISVMEDMVDKYYEGNEVVYGVRRARDTDRFFKRHSAETYYKLLRWMGADVVYNHADYRLISRRALEAFSEFKEVNLFLRGLVPLVGFSNCSVYYERKERIAGETHYPLSKMLALALDGITSLSIKPIRLITWLGFFVSLISFIGVVWAVVNKFVGITVPGWPSMLAVTCFLGGVQLISIGLIGEYVGKIYLEVKHRPRYIISHRTWDEPEE